VDDDSAGRLVRAEIDRLRPELRGQQLLLGRRHITGLIEDLQFLAGRRSGGRKSKASEYGGKRRKSDKISYNTHTLGSVSRPRCPRFHPVRLARRRTAVTP